MEKSEKEWALLIRKDTKENILLRKCVRIIGLCWITVNAMNGSILNILFDELHVKYIKKYLSELVEGHPCKYNSYGFSQILTMYHVENKGVQISKDDIELLDVPFIAYTGYNIVVVRDLTRKKIEYYRQKRWIQSSMETFCEIWGGIVLLIETSSKSVELDYKQHKR